MRSILENIDQISNSTGKIVGYLIYPGIFVLTWEVFARYIFNAPTIWAHGISERLFAVYYILSGAYLLRHRAHINMDLFYSHQSPRTRAVMDLCGDLLIFVLCIVFMWQGLFFAWESLRQLEPDATIFRAPVYPVKLMIPIAGLLLFIQSIAKFCRDLKTALTGKEAEDVVDQKLKTEGR